MEGGGNQSLKATLDQEKGEIIMRKNTCGIRKNWRDERYDGQRLQHESFKISKVR